MLKDSSLAMDSSRKSGVMGVLKEALHIPRGNKNLMLPVILFCFLLKSVLLMCSYASTYPLLLKFIFKLYILSKKFSSTPQFYHLLVSIRRDARDFLNVDMIFMIASYIVSFFSMILIVYACAMTHSGKQLTAKDLFTRIKGSWKGPFVTKFYFTLLHIGYTIVSVYFILILMLNASGSIGLIVFGVLVALMAHLLYVYLAMVWMVGVVISVLEEGCYGLQALEKAAELVKGKRVQGFLIALVLMVFEGVVPGSYAFGIIKFRPQMGAQKAIGVFIINVMVLLKLYSQMVYAVFYYDCKSSHGKEVEALGEMKYTRVPVDSNVDEDLL